MPPDLDVKSYDAFVAEVVPQSTDWTFYDRWHVGGTYEPRGIPDRSEAEAWLFVRAGQKRTPFFASSTDSEWTTWDGPADVGYTSVTTTWRAARYVEWNGRRYEHLGPILVGPKFSPSVSYEVFKLVEG